MVERKRYNVLCDVLASAGIEGLKRIAEDNLVSINFPDLRRRVRDRNDPDCYSLKRVLDYLNECIRENGIEEGVFEIGGGGKVSSNDFFESAVYITRDTADTSRLLLSGERVEFPDFLKYSTRPLKSGLIEVMYNGNVNNLPRMSSGDLAEVCGQEELYNGQYLLVNNAVVFRVDRTLRANRKGTRFEIADDGPRLTKVNRKSRNSSVSMKVPGFKIKNLEQQLAFESAIGDVEVSFITGGSGSGKSVVAYAAAVHQILGMSEHIRRGLRGDAKERIVLFKSNDIIGGSSRELGFLPGSLHEKTFEFMKSFEDAHRLCGIMPSDMPFKEMLYHPKAVIKPGFEVRSKHRIGNFLLPPMDPAIEIEHLQFNRGRTFTNAVIFVEEAQNYTPFELSTLLQRTGEGCKILIVGDPEQVDGGKNNLSPEFNGLVYIAKVLRNTHPRVSFMHLDENFRSQTAEIMRARRAPRTL